MGRDVCEASPAARAVYETADAVLGFPLSRLCFEGPEDELRRTEIQQPAMLATSIALLRALEEQAKPAPAFALGHSLGEYTRAGRGGGALASRTASRSCTRAGASCRRPCRRAGAPWRRCSGSAPSRWPRPAAAAAAETGGVVSPANLNAPEQTVIAGDAASVERAVAFAKAAGARRTVAAAGVGALPLRADAAGRREARVRAGAGALPDREDPGDHERRGRAERRTPRAFRSCSSGR